MKLHFITLCMLLVCSQESVRAHASLPDIYAYRAKNMAELRRGFTRPPQKAGPWVYWFWFANVVQREEITRELEEMAGAGIAGVELRCASMHGFAGGSPGPLFNPKGWRQLDHKQMEYLSPDFVDILEHTLSEAERLGLHFSMNLGMGWPPGGRWITEEHRSKHLVTTTKIVHGPASLALDVTSASRVGAWRSKTEKTVLPESYQDLTEKITPLGELQWTVPPGKWLIGIFQTVHGGLCDKGEGPEADPASREAMLFHLNEMFRRLDPRLSRFYGTTLVDMASDSWEYARSKEGCYWSEALFDVAREVFDYDLRSRLYALLGYGPDRKGVLHDLERIERLAIHESYFETIARFLHARGLRHRPQAYGRGLERDLFTAYAWADIPEIEEGVYVPEAVWTGRILGKPVISCESFTHISIRHGNLRYDAHRGAFSARTRREDMWKTAPAQLKALSNAHYARGVNRIQIHSFSYSPPGIPAPGWRMYAEIHLNRNVPWWPQMKDYSTWVARNQFVLQSGVPVADALVYPVRPNLVDGPFNVTADQPFSAMDALDAANPEVLARLADRPSPYACDHVVLRDEIRTLAEVRDLLELVKKGKTLWCTVSLPDRWPALHEREGEDARHLLSLCRQAIQEGKIKDGCQHNWRDVVKDLQSVRWRGSGRLSFQHRRLPGGDIYLLTSWEEGFMGTVSFPWKNMKPEIWDADTGRVQACKTHALDDGRIRIPCELDKNESTLVVFSRYSRCIEKGDQP